MKKKKKNAAAPHSAVILYSIPGTNQRLFSNPPPKAMFCTYVYHSTPLETILFEPFYHARLSSTCLANNKPNGSKNGPAGNQLKPF